MAGHAGFLYEDKINRILKRAKLQRSSFRSAGAASNAPDSEFIKNKRDWKLEIKLDLTADFGQGSLSYNLNKKKWIIVGAKTHSAEQMHEFLESIGVTRIVNRAWKNAGAPRRFTIPLESYTKEDVNHDYKKFRSIIVSIPTSAVEKYYNSKKTYYIQIGSGFGMYYMGRDYAKIGVPRFNPNLKLRIRIKRGGSHPIWNYRFSTAIIVRNVPMKSKFDIEKGVEFLK